MRRNRAIGVAGTAGRVLMGWLRARRRPDGLRATGPAGHALNAAVFGALYATPSYAPRLGFTSDAALLF